MDCDNTWKTYPKRITINILFHSYRFFVGGATEVPEPCHVYTSITWLTDSVAQFNNSRWATENFYDNLTHCTLNDPGGANHTVNSKKDQFHFIFSTRADGQ
jgi:hypothetical protein